MRNSSNRFSQVSQMRARHSDWRVLPLAADDGSSPCRLIVQIRPESSSCTIRPTSPPTSTICDPSPSSSTSSQQTALPTAAKPRSPRPRVDRRCRRPQNHRGNKRTSAGTDPGLFTRTTTSLQKDSNYHTTVFCLPPPPELRKHLVGSFLNSGWSAARP